VGYLTPEQGPRNDAHHFAGGARSGVGHHTHVAYPPYAEDERYATLDERSAERPGGLGVGWIGAGPGAAEDADPSRYRGS
jgi:hypothetical protein